MVDVEPCENDPLIWAPSKSGTEIVPAELHNLRIKQVAPSALSVLDYIRNAWVYSFYVNYLKHIPAVRWFVRCLCKNLYFFYVRTVSIYLGRHEIKGWRRLVKLEDYVVTSGVTPIKVFDAELDDTAPICRVFPVEAQTYLTPPHNNYRFPSVYVAELSNAFVYGGTNLVFCRDAVICHDLYNFERDYTSEELHGRHLIDPQKNVCVYYAMMKFRTR